MYHAPRYTVLTFALAIVLLAGCASNQDTLPGEQVESKKTASSNEDTSVRVHHVGDRRDIIHRGDLRGTKSLESLDDIDNLWAIGPVAGLQGEVTIYDGTPSISTVSNGEPSVDESLGYEAIFLAYADISDWSTEPVDLPLEDHSQIEDFVLQRARKAGLATSETFAFRLEGRAESLDYHIIFKDDDAPHDKAAHQRAKKKFRLQDREVQVIGFIAAEDEAGIYTPGRARIHMHFVLPDNSESGHLDRLRLEPGAELFLPSPT